MTSRERIRAALGHRETRKIPVDFGATRSTGINAAAYRKLREALSLEPRLPRVFDVKQALADPDEDLLRLFRADARALHKLSPAAGARMDRFREMMWDDGQLALVPANYRPAFRPDGAQEIVSAAGEVLMRKPKGGLYYDDVFAPLAEADRRAVDAHPLPALSGEELAFSAARARQAPGECALVYSTGMSFFERGIKDFGFEEFLIRIATEPQLVRRYLERLLEGYLRMLGQIQGAFGARVDVMQFNDDLGNQLSLMMSPGAYRSLFKPVHAALYGRVHRLFPGASVLLHSCGTIRPLLPDLIEAGVDAINPVQIDAAGMEPAALKRDFGRELTFWGGACSTQRTLTFGTARDVRDEAKRMIDLFAPGGGFVFNQVHNIQAGVDPEKIIALYETAALASGG